MARLINRSPYRLSIPGGPAVVDRGAPFRVPPEALGAWLDSPVGRACVGNGWIVGANGATLKDADAVKAHARGDAPAKAPAPEAPGEASGPVVRASYAEIEAEGDPETLAHWLTASNLSAKKKAAIEARLAEVVKGEA